MIRAEWIIDTRYLDDENNRLVSHLNDEIMDILEVQGSAFETLVSEVSKYVKYKIFSIPPNNFKLGKLKKIDIEEKTIIIETSSW